MGLHPHSREKGSCPFLSVPMFTSFSSAISPASVSSNNFRLLSGPHGCPTPHPHPLSLCIIKLPGALRFALPSRPKSHLMLSFGNKANKDVSHTWCTDPISYLGKEYPQIPESSEKDKVWGNSHCSEFMAEFPREGVGSGQ